MPIYADPTRIEDEEMEFSAARERAAKGRSDKKKEEQAEEGLKKRYQQMKEEQARTTPKKEEPSPLD